jgi:hypothetical protein
MASLNTKLATTPNVSANYVLKATTSTTIGNSLIFDNGTNVGIGNTNTTYTFDVTGTGRFTGSVFGDVGFRTKSLNGYLLKNDADSANLGGLVRRSYWAGGAALDTQIFAETGYGIFLNVNGSSSTGMVINSTGNVGINNTNPAYYLDVAGNAKFGSNSFNGDTIIQSNSTPLQIRGRSTYDRPFLHLSWDISPDSGVLIANTLRFNTGATLGTNSGTERVRITSIASGGWFKAANDGVFINANGNYHELTSNRANDNVVYMSNTSGTPYGPFIWFVNAAPNNTTNYFLLCEDSVNPKGIIYSNGTFGSRTGTYGSIISDIKYKQDITDANSQWDDIKNLRVVNFKYKEDVELEGENALRQIGFIAQEVEEVSPNLVYEAGQKDTEETWKSVKTSIIHLKAVKALQEAMARIEELETKLQDQQQTINSLINR